MSGKNLEYFKNILLNSFSLLIVVITFSFKKNNLIQEWKIHNHLIILERVKVEIMLKWEVGLIMLADKLIPLLKKQLKIIVVRTISIRSISKCDNLITINLKCEAATWVI